MNQDLEIPKIVHSFGCGATTSNRAAKWTARRDSAHRTGLTRIFHVLLGSLGGIFRGGYPCVGIWKFRKSATFLDAQPQPMILQ